MFMKSSILQMTRSLWLPAAPLSSQQQQLLLHLFLTKNKSRAGLQVGLIYIFKKQQ